MRNGVRRGRRGVSLAVATVAIMEARWTPEPFEADDGRVPFERFIGDLSDFKFVALDTAITHVLGDAPYWRKEVSR